MTFSQIFVIVVVAVPLIAVGANKLRVDIGALIIAVALGIAQVLGIGVLGPANHPADAVQAIAGLGQPVVVTLFSLFIITQGLDKTGVTRVIARRLLAIGGKSETRLIVLFTATSAVLSLVMNNLAAGALLLPSAIDASRRTGIKPSKLLIPVAYGSLLGGSATYFTTANIIASNLLLTATPPQAPLHILDFTPVGGLIAIAGIVYLALFGKRLLPDREPSAEQLVARRTGSELEDMYQLGERLWELEVLPGSQLAGKQLGKTEIGEHLGLAVAAIWRGRQAIFAPPPDQLINVGDILLTVGREERINQMAELGVRIGREQQGGYISKQGVSFIEVILAPRSRAEGQSLRELDFRKNYGFTAVALLRGRRSYRTDVGGFKLNAGDSILMVGSRDRLKGLRNNADFIVLEPDQSDQPLNKRHAGLVVSILAIAIGASIIGFPVYLATLAAAIVIVMSGVLSMDDAYHSMQWRAIFLIAGMYAVSIAMVQTGLAVLVGDAVVDLVKPFGPVGLAAGSYLLTAALTQIMGGQVTALVTVPIAISAALSMHTSPQAMAVASAIGCSASFLTPIAHPVNILMIGPGNYRFADFFRVGWVMTVITFIVLVLGMVLFWHL
ncbi:MAG: SLC13 family permease [Chloroflexi bacterium]|nr:SLC13 family permease [Chloroflexota bacterium]MCL5276038.1 SLC13 family permease [Chloroflexota bacterium]